MPALRLSAHLSLLLFLLSACWMQDTVPPTPAPPTPTITWANTPDPNAPHATATPTASFVTRFGLVTFGQQVYLDGIRDGELLAPKINLWTHPEGDRWIVCTLPHGAVVTVDALTTAGQHARAASVDNPACAGWVHKDFLHP